MTTLIGIAANKGRKKGVVLASDLTTTFSGWTPRGDIAVKEQSQRDSKKIYVSDDGSFAVGMAGIRDDLIRNFYPKS